MSRLNFLTKYATEGLHYNSRVEIDKALDSGDPKIRAAASHPNATKEHLDKALDDKDYFVREAAARNPNATKEHLDKALEDESWVVRQSAAKHPNATKEHLDKALNDEERRVRSASKNNPNYKKYYE